MKSAKKNIFVVDDEADILEILKINLAEAGFIVHTFSSGETAMSALKKIIPDLIILDVMMSGMDGYDFCKTVRGIPDFHAVPIIFLSAKSEEFDKVLGLELGGDDFITKPFGSRSSSRASRRCCAGRRSSCAPPSTRRCASRAWSSIPTSTSSRWTARRPSSPRPSSRFCTCS